MSDASNANSDEVPSGGSSAPSIAPDSNSGGTLRSIQILRFMAAFSVVLFHAHVALTVGRSSSEPSVVVARSFGIGASGVHVFFVISGFVMAYTSWRSRSTPRTFLSRRLVRVLPIYWLMAAFYLIAHQILGTPYRLGPSDAGAALMLWPGYSGAIIGPGWTLSFEMFFYLSFALCLFLGLRRGLVLLTLAYGGLIAIGQVFLPASPEMKLATDPLLLEFLAGAWAGFAFAHNWRLPRRASAALLAAGAVLLAGGIWFGYDRLPSVLTWGVPSVMIVVGALSLEPRQDNRIAVFFAKLGDSSYFLYLFHILAIDLLLATPIGELAARDRHAALLSLAFAIICTVSAAMGYRLIERPLLSRFRRRAARPLDDRRAASSVDR